MLGRRSASLWFASLGCSALLSTAVLAWTAAREPPPGAVRGALAAGEAYAVDVAGERAVLDLEFASGTRYLLIAGSLGSADQTFAVRLESEPLEERPRETVRPLKPWRPVRLPVPEIERPTSGLPPAAQEAPCSGPLEKTRSFSLHVTDGPLEDAAHYVRVAARLAAEGEDVRVWLDEQVADEQLAPGLVDEIVRCFDDEVLPLTRRVLGDYRDVDGDGKFAILLTPWLGRLQGGRTSLGGMVRGSDFQAEIPAPFGNHADVLYLNSGLHPGPHLQALLAHEFAHAVCFSQRLPAPHARGGLPEEDDWLNEAIAHLMENLHGGSWSNLDYRVSRYLADPAAAPLVVPDYYESGRWRDHGCRGATYLFLRWCVDQYGEGLLPRLLQAPACGTRNLEWATGERFDELFRRWAIAVWRSGRRYRGLSLETPGEPGGAGGRAAPTHAAAGDFRSLDLRGQPMVRRQRDGRRAAGDFASLDLRGRLGGRALGGPARESWNVDGGPRTMALSGTSAAFVELRASGHGGPRRLRVRGSFGARLQLSVIRIEEDWPAISVDAAWIPADPTTSGAAPRADRARLSVRVAEVRDVCAGAPPDPLVIEHVALEQTGGDAPGTVRRGAELLARADSPDSTSTSTQAFALPVPWEGPDAVLVKVVARDAAGRRAAASMRVSPSTDVAR